jgi:SP family general alpha glucoside:H+ symporter-like MFS transporter
MGNLLGMPAFRKHFGRCVDEKSGYQLVPAWQTGISQASVVGSFVGILICGQIVEPLGYRKTTLLGLLLMVAAIFATFFAETVGILLLGQFLCGIPWGFFM